MKSILIMEKIDNCRECPCSICETGWLGDTVRMVCQLTSKYVTVYEDERPEYCPLIDADEMVVELDGEEVLRDNKSTLH